ncbi:MAG: hypothetical protein HRU20_27885 [Pseudomonadales bacterium]|nr:hypothetical protein [Pseudomonadales bacterium]
MSVGEGRRRRRKKSSDSGMELSRLQRCGLLLLILPLLWLMYLAWLQMSSALFDYQSQRWLDYFSQQRAEKKAYILPLDDYKAALGGAEKALLTQPLKAEYMRHLAMIHDWYVLSGDKSAAEYGEAKKMALIYFRAAAEARPLWPAGWFDLALAKARQQERDAEFNAALIKALELGPWDESVQTGAADLSFILYSRVKLQVKMAMQLNWRRMAQHQPGVLLRLAATYKALDKVCPFYGEPQPRACIKK